MHSCLIFGCGRSGTSLLAGLLRNAGYNQGDNYITPDAANPKGYFEDQEINQINERLLQDHLQSRWKYRIRRWFAGRIPPSGVLWLLRLHESVGEDTSDELSDRIARQVSNAPFCYKDPRLCYTFPAWRAFLPDGCRFIVVYRDPVRTAHSILKRKSERPYADKFPLSLKDAGDVWHCAYQQAIAHVDDLKKFLFVHYDRLIDRSSLPVVAKFLNAEVDESFIDASASRSEQSRQESIPEQWTRMYRLLQDYEQQTHAIHAGEDTIAPSLVVS